MPPRLLVLTDAQPLAGSKALGAILDWLLLDASSGVELGVELATITGLLDSDALDSELLDSETLDSEALDSEPLDSEILDSELLETKTLLELDEELIAELLLGATELGTTGVLEGAELDSAVLDGAELESATLDGDVLAGTTLDANE